MNRSPALELAQLVKRAQRERSAALNIPYAAHVSEGLVKTREGDYVGGFKLAGAAFESADDGQINAWHERLNVLWRNLASPNLALWTHVIRRRDTRYPEGSCAPGFAADLNAKYRARLAGERLMVNELTITFVYRPRAGATRTVAAKVFERTDPAQAALEQREAIEACEKIAEHLRVALDRYEPERLGVYGFRGRACSTLLEFFGALVNGEWQRMLLPRAPLNEVLATSRLLMGTEALEYRMPTAARLGAFLGIKEYPTPTVPGMFNRLLTASFAFVLTQSFTFLSKPAAQSLLTRQYNRMVNAGDLAITQAELIKVALDDLSGSLFALGDHHWSLQVLEDLPEGTSAGARLKALNDALAEARSILADTGMVVAREDLGMEGAFWAQLPGNFALRPRRSPITSRNFAALAPFHNYPVGHPSGHHWGASLALLETHARSPYHLTLHARDERDADGGTRKDTGHTFICGPTGSGKTVLLGFLVASFTKFGATQILFDKDRGLEILVRALGGEYLPLKNGLPTGFNPLRLPPSASNMMFLQQWLARLVLRPGESLSVRQEADLAQGLRGVMALAPTSRRLSRLLEFLDPTDPEGVQARLSRWCASRDGDLAWVFDHPEDVVVKLLHTHALLGFDVTEFLDHPQVRTPVSMYIFHLLHQLLDGRRLVIWTDEFARVLADPAFESFAKDGLKTWRKMNALGAFATQSASDVLQSPIARTIIEQTPTKIFFPNPDAHAKDYCEGFGLSQAEFEWVRSGMLPGSRQFLLKQNQRSVVCRLDLKGFEFELDVISGRTKLVELASRIIAEVGPEPGAWLPLFKAARFGVQP